MEFLHQTAEGWIGTSRLPRVQRKHDFFCMVIHRGPTLRTQQLWPFLGHSLAAELHLLASVA